MMGALKLPVAVHPGMAPAAGSQITTHTCINTLFAICGRSVPSTFQHGLLWLEQGGGAFLEAQGLSVPSFPE